MERRDRDKEREREKERAEGEQGSGAIQRDKGKEKEKDGLRERNSKALAHALNTYAFASASLPFQSDLISSRAHARPHSQVVAPQNPHTSSVSYDSHSSNSISTSNSTQSDHSPQHKPQTKGKGKEKRSRPNFSTLDRTILEELKASLTARESQFAYKGPRGGLGRIGEKGFRHHPFKKEEVPYPRSYERAVVDLDVWETAWCQQLCESTTWHVFECPPTKVLDLGCGTGTWIMECAKQWKQCHFVGLDIVPLQPDLKRVGSSNMASRITWVQSNFLEALPFPDGEFDFVHVKRIARGVPEDKWDALFDEITRVMKPGGAFEMMEEDLYWPGKPRDADVDSDSDLESSSESTSNSKVCSPLVGTPAGDSAHSESPSTPTLMSRKKAEPAVQPTPTSTLPSDSKGLPVPTPERRRDPSPKALFQPPPTTKSMTPAIPVAHPATRPPALMISTMQSTPSKAAVKEAVAEGKINSESSRPSTTSDTVSTPSHSTNSHRRTSFSPSSPTTSISMSPQFSQFSPVKPSFSYPHLVRTAPKAPENPRDHTVLETIYTEMHAKRFINLAPLSLLPNNLSTWFRDVRSHPPLNVTFPPPPLNPRVRSTQVDPDEFSAPQVGPDDDDDLEMSPIRTEAPDLFGSAFRKAHHTSEDSQVTIRQKPFTMNTTQNIASSPFISLHGLTLGASPYAYLDDVRYMAFSPSAKASSHAEPPDIRPATAAAAAMPGSPSTLLGGSSNPEPPDPHAIIETLASLEGHRAASAPDTQSAEAAQELASTLATLKIRLPNTTFRLDLRTLNLHLALRTSEILACAEAMWEWVLEFQAQRAKRKGSGRLRSGSVDSSSGSQQADSTKIAIAELTRAEFDGLLTQLNMDMRDHYALGSALEERLAWSVVPMPATQDRKLFDIACDKWEQYQHQQRLDQSHHPYRRHSQLLSEAAATLSHLPTIPDTITVREGGTRPTIDLTDARSGAQQAHFKHDNNGRQGRQTLPKSRSYASLPKEPDLPEPLGDEIAHPNRLLCRTMRVFVAWKA